MLADSAVAVNPNDERYARFVGSEVLLPIVGRLLPVIADDYVKVDFGSGALKVWRSMLTDQYAKTFAKNGGIGIASHVYDALLKQQGVKPS